MKKSAAETRPTTPRKDPYTLDLNAHRQFIARRSAAVQRPFFFRTSSPA
jgi:hypothetical protein